MRPDLGGSGSSSQGAWAFLVGSGHHWRVLFRELTGGGLNEVRQERGQRPMQMHLGELGEEEGVRMENVGIPPMRIVQ